MIATRDRCVSERNSCEEDPLPPRCRPLRFNGCIMPKARTSHPAEVPARGARLRFECIFASAWLAVGLFVVPALIYWVGAATLGPYGERAGLSDFYGAYFADLAALTGRTWLLALGPLLLISLVRALYMGVPRSEANTASEDDEDNDSRSRNPQAAESRRVEPRIGN